MGFEEFSRFDAAFIALPGDNVDTDRIIPARFLTATDRLSVGAGLFADWREGYTGSPPASFPLDTPAAIGAQVLIGGPNFGCGSSREHAPWALLANGFRVIVSTRIADIFRANALKNGLLAVEIAADAHERLMAAGHGTLAVDLPNQRLVLADGEEARFDVDPFSRRCLLEGIDELGYLMAMGNTIDEFERNHGETTCAH